MNSSFVFLFPGQGSQKVGMLSSLAESFPEIHRTYEEASDVLGFDVCSLIEKDPQKQLNQTAYTQPAILAASYAIWRILEPHLGSRVVAMAGHSLGEYSALVSSGAISFSDALSLVHERGRLMQESCHDGAMMAILGLSDEKVLQACQKATESSGASVWAANYNSEGQVVVSGETKAVEACALIAKELGARRALLLPVSVPSHCPMMKPAAEALQSKLEAIDFQIPKFPIYPNAQGNQAEKEPEALRKALIAQLTEPVRWKETLRATSLLSSQFIECGPGAVLCGLAKRELPEHRAYASAFDAQTLLDICQL